MTALESRFWAKLKRLQDWHSDSTKAQSFTNSNTTHGKPGSVELRVTPYPHFSYWTNEWRKARNDEEREEVVRGLDEEWFELGHSPSMKYTVLSHGTLEWKVSIATADMPAKNVSRMYGVPLSTVYHYRKEYGQVG